MSRNNSAAKLDKQAQIFAALGDCTRLTLVTKLARGEKKSILDLTKGTQLSRQAVTKHLQVLEQAGLVNSTKSGRENLFELDLRPFKDLNDYLAYVSSKWDQTLARLQIFVEKG